MDIEILNSGTPDSKNWLNPVFDVVTCNELITGLSPATVNCFASISVGPVALPASSLTTLDNSCGNITIPNVNLVDGKYTAPRKQNINVVLSYDLVNTVVSGNTVVVDLIFTKNGVNQSPTYRLPAVVNGLERYSGIFSSLLPLDVGDELGYIMRFATIGAGTNALALTFSGFVV